MIPTTLERKKEKARKVHAGRSKISRATDEALRARKAKTYDDWEADPTRSDIPGVDTPMSTKKKSPVKKSTKAAAPGPQAPTSAPSKIKLPSAGQNSTIQLEPNAFGATSVKISNWKDTRYYIDYNYRTQYNSKTARVGWIAKDGRDWKLNLQYLNDDVVKFVRSLYPIIGGDIAQSKRV